MSRTADISVLDQAGKELLGIASKQLEAQDLEKLSYDMDAIQVLLVEFQAPQLAHDEVQWVFWHLLEGVLEAFDEVGQTVSEKDLSDFYESLDTYVESFESAIERRAKITNPRLDALLANHWAQGEGSPTQSAEAEEPAESEAPASNPKGGDIEKCHICGEDYADLPEEDQAMLQCSGCGGLVCEDCSDFGSEDGDDSESVICKTCAEKSGK